ncbi:MAG TPA: hypothetical protein VHT92_06165 [Candidatus Cybelea sp.]|jgi:hypothetical protein|nr:hypothetical protein [Candidatus Cybelea sp.]
MRSMALKKVIVPCATALAVAGCGSGGIGTAPENGAPPNGIGAF